MSGPARLVVVTGTGTGVGKTWWTAAVIDYLRITGVTVAARKPVQSGLQAGVATDAEVLAAATGETPDVVCLANRSYAPAWAPPMAADHLGAPPFTIADLINELQWPPEVQFGFVEGAGGVRSPLADDGDTLTLIDKLTPDVVVLVADAGLGTINSVRLSASALLGRRFVVALNRFDPGNPLHLRNREWLTTREGLAVVAEPPALGAALQRLLKADRAT